MRYMRKLLFMVCAMALCGQMSAQSNDSIQHRIDSLENVVKELTENVKSEKKESSTWGRKKFMTIGYVKQTLAPTYGDKMKSNIGFFLESGRTIFLHKKPLWGKLKFGIDLGADVNYIKFEDYEDPESDYGDYFEGEALISGMHQCDVGALIGALASVNPVGDMRVSAYFRFIPSYSMLVLDGDVNGSYVSFFTYGGEISWKAIGIGIEGRFGNGKYSSIMAGSEDMEDIKEKYTTSSLRAYITFRF